MESHADGHAVAGRPGLVGKGALRHDGSLDGLAGGLEHGEERVAFGPELGAVVICECLPKDRHMPPQEVRVVAPQRLEHPGRALDVGEEEGYGPSRKALAHGVILRRWHTTIHPGAYRHRAR
jgi:hypothetical protein